LHIDEKICLLIDIGNQNLCGKGKEHIHQELIVNEVLALPKLPLSQPPREMK
jgi:hypothetical protein